MKATTTRDNRRWYGLGAFAALVVAVILATLGDGVDGEIADDPLSSFVLEYFHTLAWVLLSVAFGLAAVLGRWARPSGWLALGALASYASFVAVLLLNG